MGFPCSPTTDEMAVYDLGNFEWYGREVVFPPGPLPYDYRELCPDFNVAMAEELRGPGLPQVVFMAILPNDAVKLSVLSGWMISAWTGCNRGRITEACRQEASSDSDEEKSSGSDDKPPFLVMTVRSEAQLAVTVEACILETEEIADYMRETF
ncbi:hypothetical protein Cgig2_015861 [Carnegiea gigantea]|uniref:Uncharacterized protein n=1 Tax=Carnegiea gigantea TaxID=171969 RepID=A0A9Q1JJD7_9CARY|nr:hypothetical protein Cgig2_015861 [Carnegiea gigantea]